MPKTDVTDELLATLPYAVCAEGDDGLNFISALLGHRALAEEYLTDQIYPRLREGEWRRWYILHIPTQERFTV